MVMVVMMMGLLQWFEGELERAVLLAKARRLAEDVPAIQQVRPPATRYHLPHVPRGQAGRQAGGKRGMGRRPA